MRGKISKDCFSITEARASELLENLQEMFPRNLYIEHKRILLTNDNLLTKLPVSKGLKNKFRSLMIILKKMSLTH